VRHLDLFAGIGGFSLAARWMGWETVAQVEWDEWCQKVLAKNFPDALRFGDIVEFNKMLENGEITTDSESDRRKINRNEEQVLGDRSGQEWNKENIKEGCELGGVTWRHGYNRPGTNDRINFGRIDIITGGFPCQPFSHAGKRKGTDDSCYLWPAMLETIRRVKPSYVVGENVAGLVSMENGKTLDRILSDLEDEGYTTEQVIIPACAVGAWHRRDRIWIIGHRYLADNEGFGLCCPEKNEELERRFRFTQHHKRNGKSVADMRDSEPHLGMLADGLSSGLVRWDREPEGVPRVATGVKDRVNRLKGLGNAIVPQVAYQIFKAIQKYDKALRHLL
jgi:DNA (cytosine-5)-methyltransferase 1